MSNPWTKKLKTLEHAAKAKYDPFSRVIRTPSPTVNLIFGRTHGLPLGYSVLLWGPPGGGKSLLCNATVGQLHRDDPEGIVVKFDTEYRDEGQMTVETAEAFGVDLDRYVVFPINTAAGVFDTIEQKIGAMKDAGAPIRLVIIDSINGIQGRRRAAAESIDQVTIGDHAQTMQDGLKQILPMQRRGDRTALILCAQQRSELDFWKSKKSATKAAVSHGTQHHCEYFVYVERNDTKDGKKDFLGNDLVDSRHKDVEDDAEATGHRIKVWMQKSSFGSDGRSAEFTIDYKKGVINTHEEVFLLGTRWGIIKHPKPATYIVKDQSFNGKPACLAGLAASPDLQKFVIQGLLEAEAADRITAPPEEEVKFDESEGK